MSRLLSLLTLVVAGTIFNCHAQKPPLKFGDVSMEEMQMMRYDKDSSAAAVILADFGDAYIDVNTGKMIFERIRRVKILKKEGFDNADVEMLLYHEGSTKESISNFKANTYNLVNGKIEATKLAKENVFEERFNKYFDMQKFTFPNVKVGSVIEYSYKLYSDFWTNFPNWQFQDDIPAVYSEYRARMPDFFIFEKYMQGYLVVEDYTKKSMPQQTYNVVTHRWVLRDIPAFKKEPYMTCEGDYVSKINFALAYVNFPGQISKEIMGSWAKMNTRLLESEYFGKLVDGSGFLKKKTEELTAGITDPIKKIAVIFNYIKSSIEWNKERDNTADVTNLKKVFETHSGNCAEINLALVSMLQKAGINADPVLISTKDHGFVRQAYPMTRQFNYVIGMVSLNNEIMFLDATEKLLPATELPERCLNGQGFVISASNSRWVDLASSTKSKSTIQVNLTINEDQELAGKLNYSYFGYDALRARQAFATKGKEDYVKQSYGSKNWALSESEFTDFESVHQTAKESHSIVVAENLNSAGNIVYIDPFIESRTRENPFKPATREYPVDFGSPQEKIYILILDVPQNYSVDELPKTKVIGLPGNQARYTYSVNQLGNKITITSILAINKAVFTQLEYPDLREFYNHVVAMQSQQIVLKKND